MGGKVWTKVEEAVFWNIIIPKSPQRLGADIANEEVSWKDLCRQMRAIMKHKRQHEEKPFGVEKPPFRTYTDLMLYEHYFQNIEKRKSSPNAKAHTAAYHMRKEAEGDKKDPRNQDRRTRKVQYRRRNSANSPGVNDAGSMPASSPTPQRALPSYQHPSPYQSPSDSHHEYPAANPAHAQYFAAQYALDQSSSQPASSPTPQRALPSDQHPSPYQLPSDSHHEYPAASPAHAQYFAAQYALDQSGSQLASSPIRQRALPSDQQPVLYHQSPNYELEYPAANRAHTQYFATQDAPDQSGFQHAVPHRPRYSGVNLNKDSDKDPNETPDAAPGHMRRDHGGYQQQFDQYPRVADDDNSNNGEYVHESDQYPRAAPGYMRRDHGSYQQQFDQYPRVADDDDNSNNGDYVHESDQYPRAVEHNTIDTRAVHDRDAYEYEQQPPREYRPSTQGQHHPQQQYGPGMHHQPEYHSEFEK